MMSNGPLQIVCNWAKFFFTTKTGAPNGEKKGRDETFAKEFIQCVAEDGKLFSEEPDYTSTSNRRRFIW